MRKYRLEGVAARTLAVAIGNAKYERYYYIDQRTVDMPEKLATQRNAGANTASQMLARQEWYAKGINHRVTNGRIERDLEEVGLFVEISGDQFEGILAECLRLKLSVTFRSSRDCHPDFDHTTIEVEN